MCDSGFCFNEAEKTGRLIILLRQSAAKLLFDTTVVIIDLRTFTQVLTTSTYSIFRLQIFIFICKQTMQWKWQDFWPIACWWLTIAQAILYNENFIIFKIWMVKETVHCKSPRFYINEIKNTLAIKLLICISKKCICKRDLYYSPKADYKMVAVGVKYSKFLSKSKPQKAFYFFQNSFVLWDIVSWHWGDLLMLVLEIQYMKYNILPDQGNAHSVLNSIPIAELEQNIYPLEHFAPR
jgi:hypothetical protein